MSESRTLRDTAREDADRREMQANVGAFSTPLTALAHTLLGVARQVAHVGMVAAPDHIVHEVVVEVHHRDERR